MMLSLLIRPVSKQAPGSERSSRVGTYLRSVAAVLVTFIAISAADFSTKSCTCPAPVATAPGYVVTPSNDIYAQSSTVRVYGQLWTQNDIGAGPATLNAGTQCSGPWRSAKLADIQPLISLSVATLTDPTGLNYKPNYVYVINNKTYPNNTAYNDPLAFWFTVMVVNASGVFVFDNSTQFAPPYTFTAKCIMNASNLYIKVNGTAELTPGQSYTFQPVSGAYSPSYPSPVLNYYWDFDGGTGVSGQTLSLSPTQTGCYAYRIYVELLNGLQISQCVKFYVATPSGSNAHRQVTGPGDISQFNMTDRVLYRNLGGMFNPYTVAVAPYSGGFYAAYTLNSTNNIEVRKFDNCLNLLSTYTLNNATGYVLGFAAAMDGFGLAVRGNVDYNRLDVISYDSNGGEKSRFLVMDNDYGGPRCDNQLVIPNVGALFGTVCMCFPESGRMAYGNGRFGLVFSHSSGIGAAVHNGDTFYSFNVDDVSDVKIGFSWGTSHSLMVRIAYDGTEFYTASLGDAYPENINLQRVENGGFEPPYVGQLGVFPPPFSGQYLKLAPGNITGNAAGSSAGRIGDITVLSTNPTLIGGVYSRWACNNSYSAANNTVSEIGWVTYNSSLQVVTYKSLVATNQSIMLASAKYGDNVIIAYIIEKRIPPYSPIYYSGCVAQNWAISEANQDLYIMQIDFQGNIVVPSFKVPFSLDASDGMYTLSDGSVLWPYVSPQNQLSFSTLPRLDGLPCTTSPAPLPIAPATAPSPPVASPPQPPPYTPSPIQSVPVVASPPVTASSPPIDSPPTVPPPIPMYSVPPPPVFASPYVFTPSPVATVPSLDVPAPVYPTPPPNVVPAPPISTPVSGSCGLTTATGDSLWASPLNPQISVSTTAIGAVQLLWNNGTNQLQWCVNHTIVNPLYAHIHDVGGIILTLSGNAVSPFSGSQVLTASERARFCGGTAYVNVHSSLYPGGELASPIIDIVSCHPTLPSPPPDFPSPVLVSPPPPPALAPNVAPNVAPTDVASPILIQSPPPPPVPTPNPFNCQVSVWTAFGACSLECGGGLAQRTRAVVTPEANGGAPCPNLSEYGACNDFPCPLSPAQPPVSSTTTTGGSSTTTSVSSTAASTTTTSTTAAATTTTVAATSTGIGSTSTGQIRPSPVPIRPSTARHLLYSVTVLAFGCVMAVLAA